MGFINILDDKKIGIIAVIVILLIVLLTVYFRRRTRRITFKSARGRQYPEPDSGTGDNVYEDLLEQFAIQKEQFNLISDLTLAFTVCMDYRRGLFSVSEAGYAQLGMDFEKNDIDEAIFESLILEDDLPVYDDIKNCADIRKEGIAESPYVLRIKNTAEDKYECYITRVKPIYGEHGDAIALILALINVEFYDTQ